MRAGLRREKNKYVSSDVEPLQEHVLSQALLTTHLGAHHAMISVRAVPVLFRTSWKNSGMMCLMLLMLTLFTSPLILLRSASQVSR